jgi:hypothetical protein
VQIGRYADAVRVAAGYEQIFVGLLPDLYESCL